MENQGGCADSVLPKRIVIRPIPPDDFLTKVADKQEKTKSIENSMDSFIRERKPDNIFIYGKNGTGKTATVRHLLSKTRMPRYIVPIYVNCHACLTKMALFSKITFELGNPFPRRGFAFYEVLGKVRELLEKENKNVLLILDDFDAFVGNGASDALYSIVEINEGRAGSFMLIAVADSFRSFEHLDVKIKSSLMFRVLESEPYVKNDLKEILKSVAGVVLAPDSWTDETLDKISELGATGEGNARLAIWLLLAAARNAERRNSAKVELSDIGSVYESLIPLSSSENAAYAELSQEELLILDILRLGERPSSEIYGLFQKKMGRSKRQVRNYLTSLIEKGHIESETLEDDNSFLKPRVFRLKKG